MRCYGAYGVLSEGEDVSGPVVVLLARHEGGSFHPPYQLAERVEVGLGVGAEVGEPL